MVDTHFDREFDEPFLADLAQLFEGGLDRLAIRGCGMDGHQLTRELVFPGSFSPWHEGHRQIAALAEQRCGLPVAYELSITNVDKPSLTVSDVAQRLRQFAGPARIWLTRAPTFLEKAELFPESTFVVGADTVSRISDVRYYEGSTALRDRAVAVLAEYGSRFLVFGRLLDGAFRTLSDLDLPGPIRDLCEEIPEEDFRVDISSTQLRQMGIHEFGRRTDSS